MEWRLTNRKFLEMRAIMDGEDIVALVNDDEHATLVTVAPELLDQLDVMAALCVRASLCSGLSTPFITELNEEVIKAMKITHKAKGGDE